MIIPFLRSLYYSSDAPSVQQYEDIELYEQIREHAIVAQVYGLLQASAKNEVKCSVTLRQRLRSSYESILLQNMLIKRETELLLQEFEQQGIPVIPLKGTMLAERYFGHYAARGTSDIDLLIRPEYMESAIRCVHTRGFNKPAEENPVHYHHEWYKEAKGLPQPLTVELHWNLVQSKTAQLNINTAWETSEALLDYKHVRVLSPSYTLYALCLHGASHQMDSLKYVVDIVQLIERHREDMNLVWLIQQAAYDHTSRRIAAALSVVSNLFPEVNRGASIPYKPIQMMKQQSRWYRLVFSLSMLDSWRYRWIFILRLTIPSPAVATYSLGHTQHNQSRFSIYYNLYKQRVHKLLRGLREGD